MKSHINDKYNQSTITRKIVGILLFSFAFSSSANSETSIQKYHSLDQQLKKIIIRESLTGIPEAPLKIPSIESPKAKLGKMLFFSKSLGGDKTTACATCHHPLLGGGDNLSFPIGIGAKKPNILGRKRKLKKKQHLLVPRNAPTTFNIAFWKKSLFHDGRIERLSKTEIYTPDLPYPQVDPLAGDDLVQAQARFPIIAKAEMRANYMKDSYNQTTRRTLAKRLKKKWLNVFRKGFSDPEGTSDELVTEQNFSEAISAYERSQVFINTPWKAYIEGNKKAISKIAKKGAILFFTPQEKGGAGCNTCHSGDFFTNEASYNVVMPQIGVGKGVGATKTNDYGRNLVTKEKNDKFKFRTPTLLNVEVTGPWGHDGAYTTLKAITIHMLNPIESAINYNPKQLGQKRIELKDTRKNTIEAMKANVDISKKPNLKEEEIAQIVSFLKTLTDPCVKSKKCLTPWIQSHDENDPDGETLYFQNQN